MERDNKIDEAEDDIDDLFASPTQFKDEKVFKAGVAGSSTTAKTTSADRQRQRTRSETRETRLRAELERIRHVNKTIGDVTTSLRTARDNLSTVDQTVRHASRLLSTWTRILSQTEHNQRLVLSANWEGATRDLEELEGEEAKRQQDAERKMLEEQRRKEEEERRRMMQQEEEEKRLAASSAASTHGGVRGGRARGARYPSSGATTGLRGGRGTSTSATGAVQRGGRAGYTAGRAGSGIGRGTTSVARARGRGVS